MAANVFHRYLRIAGAVTVLVSAAVLGINVLIDPLWFFGGNHLFPENYSFNERHAKTNYFMRAPKRWDCLIFGSSRATLLDERTIPGYRCFNFAVSDGRPTEFKVYARYARKFGGPVRMVIVAVDARNLSRPKLSQELPEFVRDMAPPPGPLRTYLSWSALNFSLRTLLRRSPRARYYDGNLIGDVLPGTPPYRPPHCYSDRDYGQPFHLRHAPHYAAIRETFPDAKFIGYVAPIAAWDMSLLLQDGSLTSYTRAMYTMAQQYERFYDFSIPSPITERSDNTYDGHHYDRATNHLIAARMFGNAADFGLAVHDMSLAEYHAALETALRDYAARAHPNLKFCADSGRWHPLR